MNSKKFNFALTEFSEVRVGEILGNRASGIRHLWRKPPSKHSGEAGLSSLQQRQRPPSEVVERETLRVLVSNIVAKDRVRVSQQRGLLNEVRHSIFVTLGADLQICFVGRSCRIFSGPFFPVGLGVVDGPKQP